MNKKEFIKKLNYIGWKEIKKTTKGLVGKTKIIKSKKFNFIKLPSINK